MAKKETARIENAQAGSSSEAKGSLVDYSWYLKKQGYPEETVIGRIKILQRMVKNGVNLGDPEKVKEYIATQTTWSIGHKANCVYAYAAYLQMKGISWKPPRYKRADSVPFVPEEQEIDTLINGCGKTVSIFLQALKETGADPGELWRVKWTDINEKARTLTFNYPVKRHNARILSVTSELIARLKLLPKTSENIFSMKQSTLYSNFFIQRRRLSRDFNNPRLSKISFKTFRHWKATTEYHKVRDILYVKQLLGHKKLSSTMIYIDIEKAIYGKGESDEFTTRATLSDKGARSLIAAGFQYVLTTPNGTMLFKKRK